MGQEGGRRRIGEEKEEEGEGEEEKQEDEEEEEVKMEQNHVARRNSK